LEFIINNFSDKRIIILSVGLPCLSDEHFIKGMLNGHINFLEDQDLNILENKKEQK
jgi:hypothetical protein